MDPMERITLLATRSIRGWSDGDFIAAAQEGKRLWQQTEELFEIEYGMFWDAVSAIEPAFRLALEEEAVASAVDLPGVGNRVALSFLKWERCSLTRGLPNPYEPWLSIWEHGGSVSVEHGQFVDIYNQKRFPLGGLFVRRA